MTNYNSLEARRRGVHGSGRSAGLFAKLSTKVNSPATSSLLRFIVHSLDKKMDLIRLRQNVCWVMRNCDVKNAFFPDENLAK